MGIERELQKTRDGDGDGDEVKGMREVRTGRQERSTQHKTRQDTHRHHTTVHFLMFILSFSLPNFSHFHFPSEWHIVDCK
jgi:hypothetical protein